jgi:hypothetical protein
MVNLTLTKYDIVCGILFFVVNIIFLFTNISIFNNMNKYIAFIIIFISSFLYAIANRFLYQLTN